MSTILIAYEREMEQSALEKLLSEHGHSVVKSNNGVDALESARREPPQLVISDILLPKMDGFSLCKKWKQDERLQSVPFVFYTRRHDDPKYERFALELGVDRYMERSNDNTALLKGVDELLAQGVSNSRPDTMRLQALSTGAFTTTSRFTITQPVPVAPPAAPPTASEAPAPAHGPNGSNGSNGEDKSLAREARLLARLGELDALNKQLQASEQRFRHLFDASPTPMWLVNSDDRQCIAVNQAALALYGYSREEFMALPRTAPPFSPGAAIANSIATWHRTKSGAAVAMELHTRPVELGARRGEVCAAYDVTQRVFSQQATAHAADAYQALLVAAADGIWVLDEQFNLIDVNEAYCRMSGYARDELLKLPPSQLEQRVEDEPNIRLEQWRVAEQSGEKDAGRSRYLVKHRRKDGIEYPVEVSVGGMTGARTRTVVVIRDCTAREAGRQIEQAQQQAEQQASQRRVDVAQSALQLHRSANLDEPALVRRVLELAAAATGSPLAYACATDASASSAWLAAVYDRARGAAVPVDADAGKLSPKGLAAQCMQSGQPLTVTEAKNAESNDALPPHATTLIVPIVEGDKCFGAIAVAGREAVYGADDRQSLAPLIEALGSMLAAKRAQAHTAMLAQTAEMALKGLMTSLGNAPDRR